MEKIISKQPSYVIATKKKNEFLCHGAETKYGITKDISHAVRMWPKNKAEIILESLIEENPLTPLTELVLISVTYSISMEK